MRWKCLLLTVLMLGTPLSNAQEYARVQSIETRNLSYDINRTGRIDFRHTISLSFKTSGYINELNVDEGYIIQSGEVLTQLDITDLTSSLTAAKAQQKKAEADLERGKSLFELHSISAEELQRDKTILEQAKTEVTLLKYDIARSKIISPFEAVIVERHANPGELMQAGEPVFIVASTEDNLVVRVDLTETEIDKVRLGLPAQITLNNGRQLSGIVGNIAARANPETGLFSVEIDFSDNDSVIAGQWAVVNITLSDSTRVLPLPVNALAAINNGNAVYVKFKDGEYVQSEDPIVYRDTQFIYLASNAVISDVVIAGWDRLIKERRVK